MNRSIQLTSIFSLLLISSAVYPADKEKSVDTSSVPKAAWGLLDALYNGTANYINKTTDPDSYISNTEKSTKVYQHALKIIDTIEYGQKADTNDLYEVCRQIKHRSGALVDLVADAIQRGDSIALSKFLEKPTIHFMPPLLQELALAQLRKTKDAIEPQLAVQLPVSPASKQPAPAKK